MGPWGILKDGVVFEGTFYDGTSKVLKVPSLVSVWPRLNRS